MTPTPAPRRRLIVALAAVVVAVAVAVALIVVFRGADGGPRPVLLVHGYAGSPADMEEMAEALRLEGREVVAVSLPDDNTGDLWDSAWTLGQTARDVMDATGAGSVDVVGYSAGGVVARLWASTSGSGALHRVVTIGSPHHGSEGAEIFPDCLTACEQLTPGSDFLDELSAVDETPGDAEWVSLWSETDGAVDPPDSSALEGALNLPLQAVCADADVDHDGLLSDPLAVNMVVAQLEAEEPTEFGPDDCGRFTAG